MGADELPDLPPANSDKWVFEMIQPTKAEDELERKANEARLAQFAKGN